MAFPLSPVDGQSAVVNGIRYTYASANNTWSRTLTGKYTASTSAPGNGTAGDQWYNTADDTLYEYIDDGTIRAWVDIQTPAFGANTATSVQSYSWGMSAVFGG